MVEIRCQEKDAVKLPNNIRQVGAPGEKWKIYIEDYVMTYLYQAASQRPLGKKAAILLGETVKKDKGTIFFISAAIYPEDLEIREDSLQLTTEIWTNLYEKIEKYFKDKHILGWFLTRPGQSVGVNGQIERVQAEQMKDKGVIFYTIDPVDREDAFYIYEGGRLIRQQGYYIYYERNEAMQNYMVETRQDNRPEAQAETAGFQNRFYEKRTANQIKKETGQQHRRGRSKWLPQAAGLLLMILVVAAVRRNMAADSLPVSQMVSSTAESSAAAGETQPAAENGGNLDIVESIMQQASETAGTSQQEDSERDSSAVSSGSTVGSEHADSDDTGNGENDGQDSTGETASEAEAAAASLQSYTVKEGDTLLKISRMYYQDAAHVEDIISINQIEDPDYIYPGMVLKLP